MNRPLSLVIFLSVSVSGSVAASAPPAGSPVVASCSAGDTQSNEGAFCVPLPKGLERTPSTPSPGMVVFLSTQQGTGRFVRVSWTKTSDKKRAEELRKIGPAQAQGVFEVLSTAKVPGGSLSVTHDATQSPTHYRFKSPTVQGVLVLEVGDRVLRCEAAVLVAGGDARKTASAEAAFLDACRPLRLLAKATP